MKSKINEKNKIHYLEKYFGYTGFRLGQEELIDSILAGKDAFGIMPTGAGKSICYQLPAIMMEGITLVITPLISLMKDQVQSLKQAGIRGAYFNSSLTQRQYLKALDYAVQGTYKIIYVAPERLTNREFLTFISKVDISMVAVDEAHCVSQWGQDFRPGYLRISEFIKKLPKRPVVSAFTATATAQVKDDVIKLLKLREPSVVTTGFDRKNLFFSVKKPKNKYAEVYGYLEKNPEKSGIIYCLTRKTTEEVCRRLNEDGINATRYHAGLTDEERRKNQDDFIFDIKTVMVATNAFGMGIDKSNVNFVIHYNMPKNMESYYQEAGRAGRDGEKSECILLYSGQDVITNQFFIEKDSENEELSHEERALIRQRDRQRLREMTFYCHTSSCLRNYMLGYFGEKTSGYCGNCSNCLTEFETVDITKTARKIIGCINDCDRSYGTVTILDTLRGSSTERVDRYGLHENTYYAAEATSTVTFLKQVLEYLILEGYIEKSQDRYGLLYTTARADELLLKGGSVFMKMSKKKEKKTPSEKAFGSSCSAVDDPQLFSELRKLRMKLARTQSVPPYVIFTDKTLKELCRLKPQNASQLLKVAGVGETKLKKYGQAFLKVINEHIGRKEEDEGV